MNSRAALAAARLRSRAPLGDDARDALSEMFEVLEDYSDRLPAEVAHALLVAVQALTVPEAGDAAARRRARKAAEAAVIERETANVARLDDRRGGGS